jgi:hypothetical protein
VLAAVSAPAPVAPFASYQFKSIVLEYPVAGGSFAIAPTRLAGIQSRSIKPDGFLPLDT